MMDISLNTNLSYSSNIAIDKAKTDKLKEQIENNQVTDEELMEACKSFETYMIEQVFKQAHDAVTNDKKDPYLEQFGGLLYTEYAKKVTAGSIV